MSSDTPFPTPEDILVIHEEIATEYDITHQGVLVPAPKRRLRYIICEAWTYDDVYHRAAFLLRKLITSHIFEDGNKRTGWAVTVLYLEYHDVIPAEQGDSVERVLRRIRRFEVDELATWLDTGDLDRDRLSP